MSAEDLAHVSQLVDQLRHDDVQFRALAFKQIDTLAAALGEERVREELVPFLSEAIDDEDQILVAIASKLGDLTSYIGGPQHGVVLLPPLVRLVTGEDGPVHQAALAAANVILPFVGSVPGAVEGHLIPMVAELAGRNWFTARAGAASLLPILLRSSPTPSILDAVVKLLMTLSFDEAPAVRRAVTESITTVASSLLSGLSNDHDAKASGPSAIAAMDRATTAAWESILKMLTALSADDQDSIRVKCITTTASLAASLPVSFQMSFLPNATGTWASDKAWRVRWALGHALPKLAVALGVRQHSQLPELPGADAKNIPEAPVVSAQNAANMNLLGQVYDTLLNDPEPEVRAAASLHLSVICGFLSREIILQRLLPSLQRLTTDHCDFVRAMLAAQLGGISEWLPRADTVSSVLPLILALLRDELSDVRAATLAKLDAVHRAVGPALLQDTLTPAITELGKDPQWRVRHLILEMTPELAAKLGESLFTSGAFFNLSIDWMSDTTHTIRVAAASNLAALATLFGSNWTIRVLLPRVETLQKDSSHMRRMSALLSYRAILDSQVASLQKNGNDKNLSHDVVIAVINAALAMAEDRVANIRITLMKLCAMLGPFLKSPGINYTDAKLGARVESTLRSLSSSDLDRDVRFFAEMATAALSG